MRRIDKHMTSKAAWHLLDDLDYLHLAGADDAGKPLLRCLNHVVHDGAVWFHGATVGDKLGLVDKPVVASAIRWLGMVPSWAQHREKACPASTWYESVQVTGTLRDEPDAEVRAVVLDKLMRKLQPGGGYRPITAADPLYKGSLAHIRVLRLSPSEVVGKRAAGQHKSEAVRNTMATRLWDAGVADAPALIGTMVQHASTTPEFLRGPAGVRWRVHLNEYVIDAIIGLVGPTWWSEGRTAASIASSHRRSTAWVGACLSDGTLVATCRALSDGHRFAWIADVVVRSDLRGQGVGYAMMRLLLDHPALRDVRRVQLETRGRESFYARLGFRALGSTFSYLEKRAN